MPDIVRDASAYHRSRRLRIILSVAVAVALILAGGSFALGLAASSHNAQVAVDEAQRATRRATAAAIAAEAAVRDARAAQAQAVESHAHLCQFLKDAITQDAGSDLRQDAADLARIYSCPRP